MRFKEEFYVVTEGEYQGRVGKIEDEVGEKYGNCMFYPIEGEYPYRVCLKLSSISKIKERG